MLIVTPSSEKRSFVNTLEFLSSGHRLLWNLHGAVGVFAALQRQKLECVQVARAGGQWSEMLSFVCVPWFQGISYLPVSTMVCLNVRFWKALAGILPQKGQRGLIPHLGVSAVCHSSSAEFGRSQLKILSYYLPRANFIALVFCGGKEMDKNGEVSNLII